MQVLYVTYNFAPKLGGLEQTVQRIREALCERAEVTTIAQGARGFRDSDSGILRPRSEGIVPFLCFLYSKALLGLSGRRFDLVVSGSALTALPTVHLARRFGARSAVITYGLDLIYPPFLYQRVIRSALPRIDTVIAISRATRQEAVARGADPARILIIPPGCDASGFQEPAEVDSLRERWGLKGRRVILSAGRLVKRKGVDRFIRECLPLVVRAIPNVLFLVAGGNPQEAGAHKADEYARVQQAIEETGLQSYVLVTGRLSNAEMRAAFQLADVFVLPVVPTPGDMEGFGIVLLEAGAAGLPVVATAMGGITDAVVDGETGILVRPLAYEQMASELSEFLSNEDKADQCARRGRARALAEFDWPVIARRYANELLQTD